ncbi:MAG: methyltransferase domain-containing protein [Albidovulum sp.]
MEAEGGELYHSRMIGMLEAIWGEGFLSPGGSEEVARLVEGTNFTGMHVLDIGCGAGGIDVALTQNHNAGYVCGIDVEDTVLARARELIDRKNLSARIGCLKVAPGPLPFPPMSFDIAFSKDSIVHIPDKHSLMSEVFRVLKPGGWFVASDWLIGHDNPPSPQMAAYIAAEGLDFGMASPGRYRDAMEQAGFTGINITSRNAWYRETARAELARLKGQMGDAAAQEVGREFVDDNIGIWTRMIPVLDTGEHCPTHLRAQKPA